jgi:hypothetical protein
MAFLGIRQHIPEWPWQVSALVLAVALTAIYFVFRLFDADYFGWYLANGPLIQLLVTAFALGIDLERYPDLISAHPSDYLAACGTIFGWALLERSDEVRPHDPAHEEPARRSDLPRSWPLDELFIVLFAIAFSILSLAWLLAVAPIQYFGNLVAGAPVRRALAHPKRLSIAQKPVAITASITAGLLLAISYFV